MSVRRHLDQAVSELIAALPIIEALSPTERRGIIARYSTVLEGNFIYWMTGALLSVQSAEARSIILENLQEEIRDCRPQMLRKFATAANAMPADSDAMAARRNLRAVRLFIGRLTPISIVAMAFFEGFIQRFVVYLAELAERQGATEQD